MTESITTYDQLLDRVIADGVVAARIDYADGPHKLAGAIEGFEACRGKTATEIVALYAIAECRAREARRAGRANDYWRCRCVVLEMEWVLNVLSVGAMLAGDAPLLAHLPTLRAFRKYAEIGVLGAREREAPRESR